MRDYLMTFRRSGLARVEQRQVLGSAGAAWDADAIETALTMMFSDAHQDDKGRLRQVEGGRDPRPYRPASSASTSASTSSSHSCSSLGRSSSRGSHSRGGQGFRAGFRGTFASGITEDEFWHSEESDGSGVQVLPVPTSSGDEFQRARWSISCK